jgi:hypothetical protein
MPYKLNIQSFGNTRLSMSIIEMTTAKNQPKGLRINPWNSFFSTDFHLFLMGMYNSDANGRESHFLNSETSKMITNTPTKLLTLLSKKV